MSVRRLFLFSTMRILLMCNLALVLIGGELKPSWSQSIEERALAHLENRDDRATEIARNYQFYDGVVVERLVGLALAEIHAPQDKDYLFFLLWNTIGSIEQSNLLSTRKSELIDLLLEAIQTSSTDEMALVAEVIALRFNKLDLDGLKIGTMSYQDYMLIADKLALATFLAEAMQSARIIYPANRDFWNYQSTLRSKLVAWRPDNFKGPIINLLPQWMQGPSLGRLKYSMAYSVTNPNIAATSTRNLTLKGLEPANIALIQTLIAPLPINSPQVNASRAIARARLDFLVRELKTKKVIVPSTQLYATGGPAPAMDWSVSTSIKPGRCAEEKNQFNTQGIDSHHFGRLCNYSGSDSTRTEINAALAVGTDLSKFSKATARYWGLVGSFARGGYRDHGDENQTAIVSYNASGKVVLRRCTDLRRCAPIFRVKTSTGKRQYNDYGLGRPAGAFESLKVDGQAVSFGQTVTVDRMDNDVMLEMTLSRSFKHVGACCYPGRGQSRAELEVYDVGDLEFGLEGPGVTWLPIGPQAGANSPMPAASPFLSPNQMKPDLNREVTRTFVDVLRGGAGYKYSPPLDDLATMTGELRRTVFLGKGANGGFVDDLSTVLTALYLIHDFQQNQPDGVNPRLMRLLSLTQASLSNRMRNEFKPAIENQLLSSRVQLSLVSSQLFSQLISEARQLLLMDLIDDERLLSLLQDIDKILQSSDLDQDSAEAVRIQISQFKNNSNTDALALLVRLDALSNELGNIRAVLSEEIDGFVTILAQF